MAELYLQQGHVEQALAIFRKIARERPDDATAVRRLAEVEASLARGRGEPMSFRESLQKVVESVPGALSAMVMGFDGIAIDSYEKNTGTIDLPTLLIEYSSATQQLRRAMDTMPDIGLLTEITVRREMNTCVLRPLTDEYFMAVVLTPDGLSGKARYLMRVEAPGLAKELV